MVVWWGIIFGGDRCPCRPATVQCLKCTVQYRADVGVLHTVRSTKSSCLTMLRRMDRVQQKVSHCRHLFASCLAECIEAFSAQAPRRPSFAKTGRHRDNPAHFGPHYLLLRRLLFICLPLIGSLGLFPYRTKEILGISLEATEPFRGEKACVGIRLYVYILKHIKPRGAVGLGC